MIITKSEIENLLMIQIDAAFDPQINSWVEEVERYMDQYTDRQLLADTEATTRYYNGNAMREVLIDDCRDIEEVRISGNLLTENTNYMAYPYNKACKFSIRTLTGNIPGGMANLTVKAKWGVFNEIEYKKALGYVAAVLVAGIIKNQGNAGPVGAEVKSESIGRYTVTYVTESERKQYLDAMDILKSFRRLSI